MREEERKKGGREKGTVKSSHSHISITHVS